jgi:hypothetical protein
MGDKDKKKKDKREETPEEKAARKEAKRLQEQAYVDQAMAEMEKTRAAAAAADPTLLAPFEGCTVETWAQAAVTYAMVPDPQQQAQRLAALGLDRAKYDRIAAEFMARMQRDVTGAIAGVYAKAFGAAQSAVAPAATGAGGGEPCTFDRYCEISGATAAWSDIGADVNAKLTEVFGITAMELSAYGSYWTQKGMADFTILEKQTKLTEQYQQRYQAGADPDADLVI